MATCLTNVLIAVHFLGLGIQGFITVSNGRVVRPLVHKTRMWMPLVCWTGLQRMHMDQKILCQIVAEESSVCVRLMRKRQGLHIVLLYILYVSLYVCNTSAYFFSTFYFIECMKVIVLNLNIYIINYITHYK